MIDNEQPAASNTGRSVAKDVAHETGHQDWKPIVAKNSRWLGGQLFQAAVRTLVAWIVNGHL